jgi:regulator of replication initiation timing
MTDDLTIAYQLGVEDMRSRLHKQADEIERLRAENEKLREALLYVYDNSLGLDPDKITDDVEWVTAEIRAAAAAIRESGE